MVEHQSWIEDWGFKVIPEFSLKWAPLEDSAGAGDLDSMYGGEGFHSLNLYIFTAKIIFLTDKTRNNELKGLSRVITIRGEKVSVGVN